MLERERASRKQEESGKRFSAKEIGVLVVATALAIAGIAVEDAAIVFSGLFLSWMALLYLCITHPGSRYWRAGIAIIVTSGLALLGLRFHAKALEKQQEDVFSHLQVEMFAVKNQKPFDSLFTIKNGSASTIGRHQIFCIVHRAIAVSGGGLIASPNGASDGEHDTPILPGDAETSKCPLNMFSFSSPVGCADLTIKFAYHLSQQPHEERTKPFRFVYSLTTETPNWYQVSVEHKNSYCDSD